jgi:hypothetical protein
MAEQQKGCTRSARGSIVLQQTKQQKRNLHITYVDYQKAYDSVLHSWIISYYQCTT